MNNWIEVRAEFEQAPEDWSIYIELFDRFGCPGTLQEDTPPALTAYMAEVEGADARVAEMASALKEAGASRMVTKIVPETDWSEHWKQFFKTRRIGKRLVISPTWEEHEPEPGEVVLTLDPGQAFGTGDHPTTRLCLELLERAEPEGKSVADVGCGSGILAIAAELLGAKSVEGSDIDEQSVQIARDNADLNHVDIAFQASPGFDSVEGRRDIVMSNIISATLIRLAPEAAEHVQKDGCWIVSGVIGQNWADVREAAERVGFTLEERLEEDDWIGATFRL